jgi:hypothetical protein
MKVYGINMKRDITLGAFWFTISLYFILPLAVILSQPLTGMLQFFACVLLFFIAKFCIDKTKACWFPNRVKQ